MIVRARAALKKAKLPEVEASISFGTLSVTVRGKFLMRVKDKTPWSSAARSKNGRCSWHRP
jgi:hypothetical protein